MNRFNPFTILQTLTPKSLNLVGFIFFSLFIPFAQGIEFVYDKSFTHDNSFCRFAGQSIEFEVRSYDQYTSMEDSEYGEFIVYKYPNGYKLLNMNNDGIGRFRLLKGTTPHCSKALYIQSNTNEVSVFFARENKPFGDTLTVLSINLKTNSYKVLNTAYRVKNVQLSGPALLFQVGADPSFQETGKIKISDKTFIYTKKGIEPFILFDGKQFKIDRKRTFEFYGGDIFFKSEEDFVRHKRDYQEIYSATNLERTQKCLSFDGLSWQCSK